MATKTGLSTRLDELRELNDGWLEGHGRAPSRSGLDWLERTLARHYPENLPAPYLYPTVAGGIRAEWSLNSWELSMEVDLEEKSGHWHSLHLKSSQEDVRSLLLDSHDDWQWLAQQIRNASRELA